MASDTNPVAQLNQRPLGPKTSPRQLVRRTDAVDFLDPGKQFQVPDVEFNPRPDGSQDRHPRTRRPVYLETQLHQVLDDLLYQRLISAFLHSNNHKNQLLLCALSDEQEAVNGEQ
jgi:hypothetical protein